MNKKLIAIMFAVLMMGSAFVIFSSGSSSPVHEQTASVNPSDVYSGYTSYNIPIIVKNYTLPYYSDISSSVSSSTFTGPNSVITKYSPTHTLTAYYYGTNGKLDEYIFSTGTFKALSSFLSPNDGFDIMIYPSQLTNNSVNGIGDIHNDSGHLEFAYYNLYNGSYTTYLSNVPTSYANNQSSFTIADNYYYVESDPSGHEPSYNIWINMTTHNYYYLNLTSPSEWNSINYFNYGKSWMFQSNAGDTEEFFIMNYSKSSNSFDCIVADSNPNSAITGANTNNEPFFQTLLSNNTVQIMGSYMADNSPTSSITYGVDVLYYYPNGTYHNTVLNDTTNDVGTSDTGTFIYNDANQYFLDGENVYLPSTTYQNPFTDPINNTVLLTNNSWFNSYFNKILGYGGDNNALMTDYYGYSGFENAIENITDGNIMLYYNPNKVNAFTTSNGNTVSIKLSGVPSGSGTYEQLLNITSSNRTEYGINTNGDNLEFKTSGGISLYAWVQNYNSSVTQIWVKNYDNNSIIDMNVLSSSDNLFNATGYLGEAPQLSSTYAEYDNGKYVFPYYWNFSSSTAPSGWTTGTGVTYGDGINYTYNSSSPTTVYYPNINTTGYVAVAYITDASAGASNNIGFGYGTTSYIPDSPLAIMMYADNSGNYWREFTSNTTSSYNTTTIGNTTFPVIVSESEQNTSIATGSINYNGNISYASSTTDVPSPLDTGIGFFSQSGTETEVMKADYIMMRTYVPLMPSIVSLSLVNVIKYNVTFKSNVPYNYTWVVSVVGSNNSAILTTSTDTDLFSLIPENYTYTAYVSSPPSGVGIINPYISDLKGNITDLNSNITIYLNFTINKNVLTHTLMVPIKLYNNGTSAIGEDTVFSISVDWQKYFPFVVGNVSDIRFYDQDKVFVVYELSAWLQTGNNYLDTSSTVWINLGANTISAGSTMTIYMSINVSKDYFSSDWATHGSTSTTTVGYHIETLDVSTVQFNEVGLSSGTNWTVNLSGNSVTESTSTIIFLVNAGNYNYTVNTTHLGFYKFTPENGTISVDAFGTSYVNVTFTNLSYAVVFSESGLISGVSWSVWLNNTTSQREITGVGQYHTFYAINGSYAYSVVIPTYEGVTDFNVSPKAGDIGIVGNYAYDYSIAFTYSAYYVTFTQSGLSSGTWTVAIDGFNYTTPYSNSITFWGDANHTYNATVKSSSLEIVPEQSTYDNITLTSDQTISVNFVITATIVESGYTGIWHVVVNGVTYSSSTNTIVVKVLPGSIEINIWVSSTKYTITPASMYYNYVDSPITLNVVFSNAPTNYVTAIFGNLTFIYLIVVLGIIIAGGIFVYKIRRK